MKSIFHKIYLFAQAIILITGFISVIWILYLAYNLENSENVQARNCAMNAISKDFPIGSIGSFTDKWTKVVRGHIIVKGNSKQMITEANRITKECSNYLALDVSEDSGEVSLFIVSGDTYKPAYDLEQLLYSLGLFLGGAISLSVILFLGRKWVGIVFK